MTYLWVDHELFVVSLRVEDCVDGHVRVKHVPHPVRRQDQATVTHRVNVVHVQVLGFEFTQYGESGTVTVGRYQNSGATSGTLDINILSQMGH